MPSMTEKEFIENASISNTSRGDFVAYDPIRKERLYVKGKGTTIRHFESEDDAKRALIQVYKEKYMAKEEEKKEEKLAETPEPWSPDKPIPDSSFDGMTEGEAEAQRRSMLTRRQRYLDDPEAYEEAKAERDKKSKKVSKEKEKPTEINRWKIG
jgi:hypothetical protein